MDIETFRAFCLSLKEATEGMPFDDKTLVFSVKGKMFSSTNVETFELIKLKCEPTQ